MAGDDEFDLRVVCEAVEDGVDFGARDSKDDSYAGGKQAVDDDLGDGILGRRHDGGVVS